MRLILAFFIVAQLGCVAHYRMSAEETAHLDGFDARQEHLLSPAEQGFGGVRQSGLGPNYFFSDKPYRLFHRTGYSVGFNSSTELSFVLADDKTTDSTAWMSIKRGVDWTAIPMDTTRSPVTFPNNALRGSVVAVSSPGRTMALAGSLVALAGGGLITWGLVAPPTSETMAGVTTPNTGGAALLGSGLSLAAIGAIAVVASAFFGWHLDADSAPSAPGSPAAPPPAPTPTAPAAPVPEFKPPL